MLIHFVNPPILPFRKIMRNFDCGTESKSNYLYQPYDFLLMSARVPEGWDFVMSDAVAEPVSREDLLRSVKESSPQIVVMAMADTNWRQDFEFLKELRVRLPEALVLCFGDSFQEQSARDEAADFCDGVIDNPFDLDFIALWSTREAGRPVQGLSGLKGVAQRPGDLKHPRVATLGLPRHASFLKKSYRWPFAKHFRYSTIFTAWGCPYSCSYCIMSSFPNIWRPVDEVLAEMSEVKKLGVRELYIGDRSFGVPRANAIKILNGMIANNFGFSWSAYFHPNQYDPELLELMARSGCHTLIIGIESANTENLLKYGRKVRPERLNALLSHSRKLGIEICGDFIIGLPGDTQSDIEDTIRLSKELGIEYASFNVASPLPGSSLRRDAIERGALEPGDRHFDSLGRARVLGNEQLDGATIQGLRNQAVRGFYLRPAYLLGRLGSIRGLQHLAIQVEEAIQLVRKSC